jgi:transposase
MYVVDQKVGKHIYVYEVHSYWDKEKKSPRQRRVRIGKRDPDTGEFIEKRSKRLSREYGPVYFLASLVENLGLKELLSQEFSDSAREIILAASFQVAEHSAFYLCNSWLEHIYLKEPCSLPSQKLSRLLHDIGGDSRAIYRFLETWAESRQQSEFIVFDITSISTYSKQIDFAEWGYNRDRESLPQINFGVVYGEPENLPLLYDLYPGSIPDVTTFKNLKKRLDSIASLKTLFVLDRGFYSTNNLELLSDLGTFIIPLPNRIKVAKELLKANRGTIGDTDNAFRFARQLLYSVSETVTIGRNDFTAHIYFNETQSSKDNERLVSFLLSTEEAISERQWTTASKLIRFLDNNFPDWKSYFKVKGGEDSYTLARKRAAISEASLRNGIFILLTNSMFSAEQTLSYYRRKDGVEKIFNSMKHGIDRHRLRVQSRQSMEGLLLVDFISLILYSAIRKTLRETGFAKKHTIHELFYELKKLSVIEIDEKKPVISDLTRKQKDIFKAFNIPLPVST